jgi:hypothetical protein
VMWYYLINGCAFNIALKRRKEINYAEGHR